MMTRTWRTASTMKGNAVRRMDLGDRKIIQPWYRNVVVGLCLLSNRQRVTIKNVKDRLSVMWKVPSPAPSWTTIDLSDGVNNRSGSQWRIIKYKLVVLMGKLLDSLWHSYLIVELSSSITWYETRHSFRQRRHWSATSCLAKGYTWKSTKPSGLRMG